MESVDLQNMMLQKLPNLPKKARRVTEYLLSNMRHAAFKSIGEVAGELQVSKAQLVRVARVLGFDGYAELKSCFQKTILEQINPAALLVKATDMKDELPEKILQAERANIEDTWTQTDMNKVGEFCRMVESARCNAFAGLGISALVMELAYMRFCVMGLPSMLMKRGCLSLVEQIRCIPKDSLIIACDMPNYAVDVTEAMREGHENGVKIAVITDSPAAPICAYASLSFFVSAASPTVGSSIIGPIFQLHLLTSSLVVHLGEPARVAMEKEARYLRDERFFHPIFGLKY
ncbi:MAG: MurR/RpiR family transcriptional regulator [Synergistaceae bacterium]|jgi:DNA-binding MurR/RpiR family transcriptional regulator|nr:MurR/RpiR family transcriptional regulator [Synergistaceae bacterium]